MDMQKLSETINIMNEDQFTYYTITFSPEIDNDGTFQAALQEKLSCKKDEEGSYSNNYDKERVTIEQLAAELDKLIIEYPEINFVCRGGWAASIVGDYIDFEIIRESSETKVFTSNSYLLAVKDENVSYKDFIDTFYFGEEVMTEEEYKSWNIDDQLCSVWTPDGHKLYKEREVPKYPGFKGNDYGLNGEY